MDTKIVENVPIDPFQSKGPVDLHFSVYSKTQRQKWEKWVDPFRFL